ncbi:MAG: Fe-S cluster assembly ATPase SufC [Bacilli bacterium]|nr:Fe-S cluster assembly ATPase SufC [Bacilli bacterium]
MNLEINNLFVHAEDKKILNDFNLVINKGEIHAIMGPNGTGKSTLSKVIIGNDHYIIDKGDIKVDGKSIKDMPTYERARMGIFLCFQSPVSIDGISNSEFIRTAMNANTDKPVGLYSFIKDLENNIDNLKMDKDMMHRSLNQGFSGGERKKNEILQILMLKPKLIIFDELDSGLDVDSLKIVCDNINKYLEDNPDTSVLFITHYTRILNYVKPTHVHMMNNGTIVKSGDFNLALEIEEKGYNE